MKCSSNWQDCSQAGRKNWVSCLKYWQVLSLVMTHLITTSILFSNDFATRKRIARRDHFWVFWPFQSKVHSDWLAGWVFWPLQKQSSFWLAGWLSVLAFSKQSSFWLAGRLSARAYDEQLLAEQEQEQPEEAESVKDPVYDNAASQSEEAIPWVTYPVIVCSLCLVCVCVCVCVWERERER